MSRTDRNFFDLRAVIGFLIVIFAVVLLLRNMELIPYINMWAFWPVFLIVIGLSLILRPEESRQLVSGSIFIIIGGLFFLNNMHIIYFGFRDIWPFLLLLVGFAILRQAMYSSKSGELDNDFINLTFIENIRNLLSKNGIAIFNLLYYTKKEKIFADNFNLKLRKIFSRTNFIRNESNIIYISHK